MALSPLHIEQHVREYLDCPTNLLEPILYSHGAEFPVRLQIALEGARYPRLRLLLRTSQWRMLGRPEVADHALRVFLYSSF